MKKNSCMPINPKKYPCYGLKKNSYKEFDNEKKILQLENSPPIPHNFFNVASLKTIGTLRSNDADGNENVTKTIGLISKTTTLHVHHAFLYISLPVFARLRREHA